MKIVLRVDESSLCFPFDGGEKSLWYVRTKRVIIALIAGITMRGSADPLKWAERRFEYTADAKTVAFDTYERDITERAVRHSTTGSIISDVGWYTHRVIEDLGIYCVEFGDSFGFSRCYGPKEVSNALVRYFETWDLKMEIYADRLVLPVAFLVECVGVAHTMRISINPWNWYIGWNPIWEAEYEDRVSHSRDELSQAVVYPASTSWAAPILLNDEQYNKYDSLFTDPMCVGYGEQVEVSAGDYVCTVADAKLIGDDRKMLMRPKELQIVYLRDTDDYDIKRGLGYYPVDESRTKYLSFENAVSPVPQGSFRLPGGLPITGVGCEAFQSCPSLVEIVLPDNVVALDARAFIGCENLSNVVCEGDCVVDKKAFEGCAKLKTAFFLGGCRIDALDVGSDFVGLASSMKYPEKEGAETKFVKQGVLDFASMSMSPSGNVKSEGAVKVSMTASHGLKVVYTTDGSEPRENSGSIYTSALRVSGPVVIKAASFLFGHQMTPTKVLRLYEGGMDAPTVRIMPEGGAHFSALSQLVEIKASHDDAEIFYTLDGSVPTDASMRYAGPIQISETTTIKAIAYRGNHTIEGSVCEGVFIRDVKTAATPMIYPKSVQEFDYSNFEVSIECTTSGARIYYTLNGRDPLVAGEVYGGPFGISESTIVRAIATCEGCENSQEARSEFSRVWHKVATPSVKPGDKVTFMGSKTFVSADCETAGATIYYWLDGDSAVPKRTKYTGPVEMNASATINFVAVKDDWQDSDVVSIEVEKIWQYGDGVGNPDQAFTSGGDSPWVRDEEVSHDGRESIRSGEIDDGQISWIETRIDRSCAVSFWWRTSCEDDQSVPTADWDHLAFFTNGVEVCRIDGETDWSNVSISCDAQTTLRWEYVKDDSELGGEDCGWIDDFTIRAISYSVTFDANGGQSPEGVRTYEAGQSYGRLPVASRVGYSFLGWFTAAEGGTAITEEMSVSSSMTVYAHWEAIDYSIIAYGGAEEGDFRLIQMTYGDEIVSSNVWGLRCGMRLLGWATEAGGEVSYPVGMSISNLTTTAGAEVKLYAVWGEAGLDIGAFRQRYPWNGLVDVEFTLDGDAEFEYPLMLEVMDGVGMTNLSVRTTLGMDGKPIGIPFFVKPGSRRIVWDAGADLPDGYRSENVTARLRHAMSVEFNACGGTCEVGRKWYALNDPYGDLPKPMKSGCVFKGWYSDAAYKDAVTGESLVSPSVAILYAKWEEVK